MFTFVIFLIALILCNCNKIPASKRVLLNELKFRVVYEWHTIDVMYRNETERKRAVHSGEYIKKHILISDIEAYGNRLYLTMPRFLNGIPITLGWIVSPEHSGRTNPAVEPFPSLAYNKEGDCRAMQFVQGITIDRTGFMWVVDSGKSQTLIKGSNTISCIPKLLIFNLNRRGAISHVYEFPEDVVARGKNYLSKIVVDDAYGGYAYITDYSKSDPGIVVYSKKLNHAWKIWEKHSMTASVDATNMTINGTSIHISYNINSITLGPYIETNFDDYNKHILFERNVYYSPLSSYHLYSIPASILRDPNFTKNAIEGQIFDSVTDYGLKTSQTDGMIMDNGGILYFSLLQKYAIAKWDSYQPFTPINQKIIARDKNFIQWVDGMTIDGNSNIFVIVNRYYNYLTGRFNQTEVNFRILKAKVNGQNYVMTNKPVYKNLREGARFHYKSSSFKIIFHYWNIIFAITIERILC